MKIVREINKDGNLLPKVINIAYSLPENILSHKQYFLRHPKVIAYRSVNRIFEAFNNVLDLVNNLKVYNYSTRQAYGQELSKSLIDLFEAIISHIEDCFHILKSTCPYFSRQEKFVHRFLEKNKHPSYQSFYDKIKNYREEIAVYVNKVKHEHGILDIVIGHNETTKLVGYYMKNVEECDDNTITDVIDMNSLRALNFDLKYHFFNLYHISEAFSDAVSISLSHYHGITFSPTKVELRDERHDAIFKKLDLLEPYVFPNNEIVTPKTLIEYNVDELVIEYPIGITEQNVNCIIPAQIKGLEYPKNMLIFIPREKVISQIKNASDGDKFNFITDDESFDKLLLKASTFGENDALYHSIEVTYNEKIYVKTYSNIGCELTFISGVDSNEFFVKIFEIDYLGFKIGI